MLKTSGYVRKCEFYYQECIMLPFQIASLSCEDKGVSDIVLLPRTSKK